MKRYKLMFKNKDFMLSVYASVLNAIGDSFDGLAISLLVYAITGSKFWFAINFAINALPNLIIQPFVGPIIEKMDRKRVMVIADYLRAGLVVLLLIFNYLFELSPYAILVFTFMMTCLEAFRIPAGMVLNPSLVDSEHMDLAISLKQSTSLIIQVSATALAGFVIGVFGLEVALLIDALCFIGSALFISAIKTKLISSSSDQSYIDDLKAGWLYFKRNHLIMMISIFGALITLLLTGVNVMIMPYLLEERLLNPSLIGVFSSIQLIAMLCGSLVFPFVKEKLSMKYIFVLGVMFMGLAISLLTVFASLVSFYAIVFLMGLSIGLFQSALSTLFITSVDPQYLSRAGAIFNATAYASTPIGSVLISIVMVYLPYNLTYIIYGIMIMIISLVFLVIIRKEESDASLKN